MKGLFHKLMGKAGNGNGWVIADQAVFSAASFFTTVLLARMLGPASFGLFSVIQLALYLLLGISTSLVVQPFQVLSAAHLNQEGYIRAVFFLQLLVTFLLMAGIAVFLHAAGSSAGPFQEYEGEILLLAGAFLMQDFFRRLFIALQLAKYAFVTDTISAVLQLVLLIAGNCTGLTTLSFSLIAIGSTSIPAIAVALYLLPGERCSFRHFKQTAGRHWQQGRWLLITALLQWWAGNFIVALSGVFLGIRALGALRLAQTILGLLSVLFQVLENHAVPRAAAIYRESSLALKNYLSQLLLRGLLLLVPVLLVLVFFPEKIFGLCGGQAYSSYAYALRGMAVLNIFIFAGYPLRIAIRVMLMNKAIFTAYLLSFLFTMLTAEFIVSQWQLSGVIVALILNQLIILGYWYWMLVRKEFILWK